MGAPTSGGGVVETIRRQLAAGHSGDAVVDGLVAGGLSRPSAERFVQRAGGQVTTAAPPPIPAAAALPPPVPMVSSVPAGLHASAASEIPDVPAAATPDAPPPLPAAPAVCAPPPVPTASRAAVDALPVRVTAPTASVGPTSTINGLKLAGGAALLLVGLGLLAASLSAEGRVRLKLPIALVLGGGVTLVQAIRER